MSKTISIAEVKKHRSRKSLWIIIHNDVYDVSKYLDEHPGGEEVLLDVAGSDGTQEFEDVGHSADARELMMKYKIGTLSPEDRDKAEAKCNLKWYILALLGAIVIGVVLKKKLAS